MPVSRADASMNDTRSLSLALAWAGSATRWRESRNREHEGMKKALALGLLLFAVVGLLLTTGCFETTSQNTKELKDWTEVTFADGDEYLKEVR